MKSIALLAVLLAGCNAISPEYYRTMSTEDICKQVWTVPAYNINNPARYAELERRQTGCGDPPAPPAPAPAPAPTPAK